MKFTFVPEYRFDTFDFADAEFLLSIGVRGIIRGAPRRIRTFDLPVRSRALYPLSYGRNLERVMGIEPTRPAWKAGILPLNYTRTQPLYNITLFLVCQYLF